MKDFRMVRKIVENGMACPGKTAIIYRKRKGIFSYTYGEVLEKVAAIRSEFLKKDIHKIGLLGENSPEYIFYSSGMLAAGMDVALLDTGATEENLKDVIVRSDLETILCDEENLELAQEMQEKIPGLKLLQYEEVSFSPEMLEDHEKWVEGEAIFFTSGTSKSSKIVMTPTKSMEGNLLALRKYRSFQPETIFMNPLPFHHSFGYTILHAFYLEKCPIFVSSMRTIIKDMKFVNPVNMALVPSAVEHILKKGGFVSSVKYVVTAGAYLPMELAKIMKDEGLVVQNMYGSSEIPSGFAINLPEDEVDTLSFHDEMEVEIAPDGEVIIQTEYTLREYYKNPEDTAELMVDGKIHTGDIGFLDDNGKLHLLGRRKNMVIMENGEKVFYTDLDEGLKALPIVNDGAVIYRDKKIIAVLDVKSGVAEEDIKREIHRYNQSQPVSRQIRGIWNYGGSLPYTSSGKLKRSQLEKEYK